MKLPIKSKVMFGPSKEKNNCSIKLFFQFGYMKIFKKKTKYNSN